MDRTYDQKARRYVDEEFGQLVNECLDDPENAAHQIANLQEVIDKIQALAAQYATRLGTSDGEIDKLQAELGRAIKREHENHKRILTLEIEVLRLRK